VSAASSHSPAAPVEFATRVWNQLSDCVDAFIGAWDNSTEPPRLAEFIPPEEAAVQRLIFSELVKVDLEYRWRGKRYPKLIEEYLAEFPEMADGGRAPVDLVYEEYHVRRQAGDDASPEQYFRRFPGQETELRRLLKLESPHLTTTLFSGPAKIPGNLGDRIDDFDLLTELGRGAFASVYLARQRSMQRMVALKVSADKGSEPQTLAQLDHPNIVRVYDQRQLPERKLRLLYMQYVPGGTLEGVQNHIQAMPPSTRSGREYLKAIDRALDQRGESLGEDVASRTKLSHAAWPDVVCWLGSKLASALAYAHQMGVLHRDLKPANVLVAADGNPKLADFNISFSSKVEGATPAAYFGGSLAYMSPEQLEACNPACEREPDSLDGRSDVFSLGVMLWELLTGARPFPDEKPNNDWSKLLATMVARRTAGVDAQVVARLPRGCPAGLPEVLLKCMAADPAERYSAAEAARQFDICLLPRARRLLHAPHTPISDFVRKFPTTSTVVSVVAINLVLSVLNIAYNAAEIVKQFHRSVEEVFWRGQIPVINAISYSLGIGIVLALSWPVFTAVKPNPPPIPPGGLRATRSRCLRIAGYLALVVIALWVVSGLVLPVWLAAAQRQTGHTISIGPIAQFFMSQVLCGLIAMTMSYFVLLLLAVRYYYPQLLQREHASRDEVEDVIALSRRIWVCYVIAFSVPFMSIMLLVFIESAKTFVIWLGVLGAVGFALAYLIDRAVRDDLAALAQVINPAGSSLGGTESSDSFFSSSRR
jgi:serine/threonine protein kinase